MDNNALFLEGDKLYEHGKFKQAFETFMCAATNGDSACMNRVALMYTSGEGVEGSYDKAIEWELKSIQNGDLSAKLNVGISYRMIGNIKQAKYWFEQALNDEDGSAALELAKLYMVSDKEKEKVKHYLTLAIENKNMCESDVEEAKQHLSELY